MLSHSKDNLGFDCFLSTTGNKASHHLPLLESAFLCLILLDKPTAGVQKWKRNILLKRCCHITFIQVRLDWNWYVRSTGRMFHGKSELSHKPCRKWEVGDGNQCCTSVQKIYSWSQNKHCQPLPGSASFCQDGIRSAENKSHTSESPESACLVAWHFKNKLMHLFTNHIMIFHFCNTNTNKQKLQNQTKIKYKQQQQQPCAVLCKHLVCKS